MAYVMHLLRKLAKDEDGASLVEYIVLLAVITIAVIIGIGAFGEAIGNAFSSWAAWIEGNAGAPPDLPIPGV